MIQYAPPPAEDEDLPPELALWAVDQTLVTLPEHARPAARRLVLSIFANAYDASGVGYPEWLRVGLEQAGESGPWW